MEIIAEKECDLDCPISPKDGKPYCCGKCYRSRKYFITDSNRHLWTDNHGFWSETGCRLKREDMPEECRRYNCRDYTFIGIFRYTDGKWQTDEVVGLRNEEITPVKLAINMTIDKNREIHGNRS